MTLFVEIDGASVSVVVWMTNNMSDYEEDSGVHSQIQDERTDSPADNEGVYAVFCLNCEILRFVLREVFASYNCHCSVDTQLMRLTAK